MKLHLPSCLRALLAAVLTAVPQAMAATLPYSGTIYTWVAGSNNSFHQGLFYETTQNSDGSFTTAETATGQWNRDFCAAAATGSNDTSLDTANTLRLADSGAYATVNFSFTPLTIGGLIVEPDCSVLRLNGGNRAIRFGNSSDTVAYSVIDSDFTLSGGTSTTYLRGTQQWDIAEDAVFTLASPSLVQRSLSLQGSGAVAFSNTLSIDTGATLQLSSAGELQIGQSIANSGTLHLAGRVNLLSSLAAPTLTQPAAGTNGFASRGALSVTVISGNGTVAGADSVTWALQGSLLDSSDYSYANGVLDISAGDSSIYYIQADDSTVTRDASTLSTANGFVITATGTNLTLLDTDSHDISNRVSYSGGGSNALIIGSSSELADTDITRTGGGTLRVEVQGVLTLRTANVPVFNGAMSIGPGGEVTAVAQDAFGYSGGSGQTASLTLGGSESAPAVLRVNQRQTMSTPIALNGYTLIDNTDNAVSSGAQIAGLEAFGYSITATGGDNEIATRLLGRNGSNVPINVPGESDELLISGVVKSRGGQGDSNYIKTGEGTLTFSADGNEFTLPYQHREGLTVISGQAVFREGFTVESGSVQVAAQGEVTSVVGINTEGKLVVDGLLLLGGDSSLSSLSGAGMVSATDSSLSLVSSADIGAIQAENLRMTGSEGNRDLTLSSASQNSLVGSMVDIDTLTIGPAASLAVSGALSVNRIVLNVDALTPLLTVGTLNPAGGSAEVQVDAVAGEALLLGMSNGDTLTLATIDANNAALQLTVNGAPEHTLTNASGFTYKYTLVDISDGGVSLQLTATRDAVGWVGDSLDVWSDGSAAEWVGTPPSGTAPARFFGDGSSDVRVSADGVTAEQVIVSAGGPVTSYTFSGGAVSTTALAVSEGELRIANRVEVNDTADSSRASGLVVVGDSGSLSILAGGMLRAEGELQVQGSGSLSNAGQLSVASLRASSTSVENSGTISLSSGTLGGISGGSLVIAPAGDTPAGTVSVVSDVNLSSLSGSGQLAAIGHSVTLSSASGSVGIAADSLTLLAGGAELGDVQVDSLTLGGSISLNSVSAPLRVSSLAPSGESVGVMLSPGVFATIPTDADSGRYVAGDYLLIDGVSADTPVRLAAAESMQAILRYGLDASALVEADTYLLRIAPLAVPMSWVATGGNRIADNGYIIPEGSGFYRALDYVEEVRVGDTQTFDLSQAAVGNAVVGNATVPAAGLFIRNLTGSGRLSIIGDGVTQDIATLINTEADSTAEAVSLTAQGVRIQLGLPDAINGILPDDHARAAMRYSSLNLREASELIIAENQPVLVSQLNGQEDAGIAGVLSIDGQGGAYSGSYENALIYTLPGSGQTLASGSGLSLVARGGQTTLVVGSSDPAVRRLTAVNEVLTIDNTVLDATGTFSRQTLRLAEPSSIEQSTLSISLPVESSGATLGTPQAPILLQGELRLSESHVILQMAGNGSEPVLPVNTSAGAQNLLLAVLAEEGEVSQTDVELTGSANTLTALRKYYTNPRLTPQGDLLVDRVSDYYRTQLHPVSSYGHQGLTMADSVLLQLNPQADATRYPALAAVLDALDSYVAAGDAAQANRLATSLTGASAAALNAALAGDMERQLQSIRNRTTSMGADPDPCRGTYAEIPAFHAWVNAEGDHRYLSSDGEHPGYSISSWGATLGADAEVSPALTVGLAFSYMHGDFEAKSVDSAEGDADFYYISAFARYAARCWTHTFVGSIGWAGAELDRHLPLSNTAGGMSGDADALSLGFLYELGYSIPLDEYSDTRLQPIVNVLFSHTSVDSFSERGSDVALRYGGCDVNAVTFGLGARIQGNAGETINERVARAEARALLKLRAGDRSASVSSSLVALPSVGSSARSAEVGMIGAEFGAGIIVPLGVDSGAMFLDASFEFSSGYTEVNGVVGYRLDF